MIHEKDLTLILARDLASKLATPTFIVDPEGTLLYYNEPAETVLGTRYAETGEMAMDEWGSVFSPVDPKGDVVPVAELPLSIAISERRPAHRPLLITGLDGVQRTIAVTAFPLIPHPGELVGAVAIFWEEAG